MSYTNLNHVNINNNKMEFSLDVLALNFINNRCEDLRYLANIEEKEKVEGYKGTSLKKNQIPYNMEKDIDRLCFANAIKRFVNTGKKEDAFDVYFCYLEMFIGDYDKTRRMIELLSEFEANGSGLLMKHRDHYSHSVYVFLLGLAIYESNEIYRDTYKKYYNLIDDKAAAHHFLKYWGLASLFHDIGYPFELPFEQVCSYFEVEGNKRKDRPFVAYKSLENYIKNGDNVKEKLKQIYTDKDAPEFITTNELFAYVLYKKLSKIYNFTYDEALTWLKTKSTNPDLFNNFMDHAYFSSSVLFERLFDEMQCEIEEPTVDALVAILIHNSLFKFQIEKLGDKKINHIPFDVSFYPLAFLLMLCDELQCWDRTAYGRNSKKELHPMGVNFDFSNDQIKVEYLYDENEKEKVDYYVKRYEIWLKEKPNDENDVEKWKDKKPTLKAYSNMYEKKNNGITKFQSDIEEIVSLSKIKLTVTPKLDKKNIEKKYTYLSESNFINLYNFAVVLNGRYQTEEWKKAKEEGKVEEFLNNKTNINNFTNQFKELSLEYKLSNINQAKSFAKYMDSIGCFYTNKQVDFELKDSFTEDELQKIGKMEHMRWLQEHIDMGWRYGTQGATDKNKAKDERENTRLHQDMIPDFDYENGVLTDEIVEKNYNRLNKSEQDKDKEPMECMLSMLKMFDGLRIYKYK